MATLSFDAALAILRTHDSDRYIRQIDAMAKARTRRERTAVIATTKNCALSAKRAERRQRRIDKTTPKPKDENDFAYKFLRAEQIRLLRKYVPAILDSLDQVLQSNDPNTIGRFLDNQIEVNILNIGMQDLECLQEIERIIKRLPYKPYGAIISDELLRVRIRLLTQLLDRAKAELGPSQYQTWGQRKHANSKSGG